MTVQEVYLHYSDKLNKLTTNTEQWLTYPSFVRIINEAQYTWTEQRLKLEEVNKTRQNELQRLLKDIPLGSKTTNPNSVYYSLPDDYLRFSRLEVNAKKGSCERKLYTFLAEEGNLNVLLSDAMSNPSFEWEETLTTVKDNKLYIYTDTTFTIESGIFTYYRKPKRIDIAGYETLTGQSSNSDPEWTNAEIYEIINLGVQIASGNTQDQFRYQTISQENQAFT